MLLLAFSIKELLFLSEKFHRTAGLAVFSFACDHLIPGKVFVFCFCFLFFSESLS